MMPASSLSNDMTEPQIVEFGPYRVIGAQYVGKNEHREIPTMWEQQFLPRMWEIIQPEIGEFSVGLCRCLPDVGVGVFEYIAGVPVSADAPIPDGMAETTIPRADYVVFPVASLANLSPVWEQVDPWLAAHPEWEGYCTPKGCDCAHFPNFELYPPTFGVDGKLFVYVPVHRSE
jgi:predicted transcriptional regulator YdeE